MIRIRLSQLKRQKKCAPDKVLRIESNLKIKRVLHTKTNRKAEIRYRRQEDHDIESIGSNEAVEEIMDIKEENENLTIRKEQILAFEKAKNTTINNIFYSLLPISKYKNELETTSDTFLNILPLYQKKDVKLVEDDLLSRDGLGTENMCLDDLLKPNGKSGYDRDALSFKAEECLNYSECKSDMNRTESPEKTSFNEDIEPQASKDDQNNGLVESLQGLIKNYNSVKHQKGLL